QQPEVIAVTLQRWPAAIPFLSHRFFLLYKTGRAKKSGARGQHFLEKCRAEQALEGVRRPWETHEERRHVSVRTVRSSRRFHPKTSRQDGLLSARPILSARRQDEL